MTVMVDNPLAYFPYIPRPHQERAVTLAAQAFKDKTVGLLSADCGIGKSIAVLSGYLSARLKDTDFRLFILTRTHSQSRVFENELSVLRENSPALAATTMVSRVHICPNRQAMSDISSTGFMRACNKLVRTGRCTYYWNFYTKSEGRISIRDSMREEIESLLIDDVVRRNTIEDSASRLGVCPYELMRWCARQSNIIIGPYSYVFKTRIREAMLNSLGCNLHELDILVDEAHNLPDNVLDSETAELTGSDLKWLHEHKGIVVKETGMSWLGDVISFLWETVMVKLDQMKRTNEFELDKWDVCPRFVKSEDIAFLSEVIQPDFEDPEASSVAETPLDRLLEFLFAAMLANKGEDWHISIERQRRKSDSLGIGDTVLYIRPLNSAGLTAPVLRGARATLLMSGTLRPVEHYANLLGVKGALAADLASPYPRGTRLVLIDKEISTKYTNRSEALWRQIANRISVALTAMPSNKTALVAFPSYKIMNEILSYGVNTGYRSLLVETPRERLDVVAEAVATGPQAVFCVYGGKFSEGIDLVESGSSLIDLIIGVGIPFRPPTSYQRALQDWFEKRFGRGAGFYYGAVIPSIRQVAQLLGRLRRSPEDWGCVVLLDKRFLSHLSVLGADMVSDVWPYSDPKELEQAISNFVRIREGDIW